MRLNYVSPTIYLVFSEEKIQNWCKIGSLILGMPAPFYMLLGNLSTPTQGLRPADSAVRLEKLMTRTAAFSLIAITYQLLRLQHLSKIATIAKNIRITALTHVDSFLLIVTYCKAK